MTNDTPAARLAAAREEIDALDQDLVELLARRLEVVRRVGDLKGGGASATLRDEDRERRLRADWCRRAEERGLSGHFAGRVLREILVHSRRSQEGARTSRPALPRVAFQGVAHSYSELALRKLFGTRSPAGVTALGFPSFREAAEALENGQVDHAFLPIENSIAGAIGEVDRLLAVGDLHVIDEETWEVEHVLAGLPGAALERLERVRSHPVALAQCGAFLGRLGGVQAEPWGDTAGAAADLAHEGNPRVGVLCSEEAAEAHGLEVLVRNVADRAPNVTRFLLLARTPEVPPLGVAAKTSLYLTLDHREGALARVLGAFAEEGINLTRIESKPDPRHPWQYAFFVDVEGHVASTVVERALSRVREHCNLLRILGSFPLRTQEGEAPRGSAGLPPSAREDRPEPRISSTPAAARPPELSGAPLATCGERARGETVRVGDVAFGGARFVLIAGPCAVESQAQIEAAARMVARSGAALLRGGAFKPRSSPYSFQGLGLEGLALLRAAGDQVELPVVTEVLRIEDLDAVAAAADMIQVGARNMQNFALLRELGRIDRPVLLKRGLSATVKELLMAAEYIMAGGNQRVILCERGIRTFETATRNTLDLGAVAVLKTRTHLPVIVDPSHAAGERQLVVPLALAAAAVGADGLIVEAHPDPENALCDKEQALHASDLERLVQGLGPILASQGRSL